jgi:hypothetical protein
VVTVSALFIDPKGIYPKLLGPENCWDQARDARTYAGPHPVIAHPPCLLWCNMAAVNYKRAVEPCGACLGHGLCAECQCTRRKEPNRKIVLPAWYPGGTDEGCFQSALNSVRKYGGVLEHPAFTHAWNVYNLQVPVEKGWQCDSRGHALTSNDSLVSDQYNTYWTCEVWQSAYGHKARKRTWLLYCGKQPPFELNWSREPGECQIGWFDRNKKTLSKREASATPLAFAEELIRLAEWSRQ